eukprot:TRINITY_DN3593_c0_g1_i1.p1 TRINITY_DN3593_c0_g1~~TRINITY_DN3593_c0_g1_i1.p1  ORF type:complete len:198 (-),score=23.85 TRINITY_DN3593_c0_g1_i1:87-680(-)
MGQPPPSKNVRKPESYEDLAKQVNDANNLTSNYQDNQGRKLVFTLYPQKRGDIPILLLWKLVCHVQVSYTGDPSQQPKMLTVRQFSKVYNRLLDFFKSFSAVSPSTSPRKTLESPRGENECAICLDRESTLVLPCSHSFCSECLEEWKKKSDTCPFCRSISEGNDELFVLTNPPTDQEISEYFQNYLNKINQELMTD